MSISKISFKKFRNLKDISLDIKKANGVLAVAGVNGSGKSNFLESIVSILRSLSYRATVKTAPSSFTIDFEHQGNITSITKDDVGKASNQSLLPKRVIVVYSGSLQRMQNLLMSCKKDKRFFYVSYAYVPVVLLLLFASKRESIVRFVHETLHFKRDFKAIIKYKSRRLGSASARALYVLSDKFPPDKNRVELSGDDVREMIERAGTEFDLFDTIINDCWCRKRDGFIDSIKITYESEAKENFSSTELSEGELKLAFFKGFCEFIVENDCLLILDEPDTHIHEKRKLELLEMFNEYAKDDRQIIFTSHSPGLINGIDENSLASVVDVDGKSQTLKSEVGTADLLTKIGGDRMQILSNRPIVLFEGKSDVEYLKMAVAALRRTSPAEFGDVTDDLGCELLTYGGSGDVKDVYVRFREIFPRKRIAVFCDYDSGGEVVMNSMIQYFGLVSTGEYLELSKIVGKYEKILNSYGVYFIPPAEGSEHKSLFCIEDYFSKDFLSEIVVSRYLQSPDFNSFSSLFTGRDRLKQDLMHKIAIPDIELIRFKPLIEAVRKIPSTEFLSSSLKVTTRCDELPSAFDAEYLTRSGLRYDADIEKELRKSIFNSDKCSFIIGHDMLDGNAIRKRLSQHSAPLVVLDANSDGEVVELRSDSSSGISSIMSLSKRIPHTTVILARRADLNKVMSNQITEPERKGGCYFGESWLFYFQLMLLAGRIRVSKSLLTDSEVPFQKLSCASLLPFVKGIFKCIGMLPSYTSVWFRFWKELAEEIKNSTQYDVAAVSDDVRQKFLLLWNQQKAYLPCEGLPEEFYNFIGREVI